MRIRFFEERPRFARNRAQQSHCCGLSRMLAHAQSHGMRSFEKYSQSRTGDSPVRYKHDTPTGFAKGFVSFDLLFCAIPLLLMLSHFLIFVWMATQGTETSLRYGETTGKLATIADYLVKRGAVERGGDPASFLGASHYSPNLIADANPDVEEIRKRMGLEKLSAGVDIDTAGGGTCVYRLVIHNGEIKKFFVCGE